MKSRIVLFYLLLALACKDGGQLPDSAQLSNLIWVFNNSIASQFFESGQLSNSFSYSNSEVSFSFTKQITTGCPIPLSDVTIDRLQTSFESVNCYVVRPIAISGPVNDYFVISAVKKTNNYFFVLSYSFSNASPESRTYRAFELVDSVYSVYEVDTNRNFTLIESYRAVNGFANIFNINGIFSIDSRMDLQKISYGEKTVTVDAKLSCCKQF